MGFLVERSNFYRKGLIFCMEGSNFCAEGLLIGVEFRCQSSSSPPPTPPLSPLSSLFSLFSLTTLSPLSPSLAVFTSIHTLAYTFSLIISSSLKECSQQIFSTSLTLSTLVALAFTLLFASLFLSSPSVIKNNLWYLSISIN